MLYAIPILFFFENIFLTFKYFVQGSLTAWWCTATSCPPSRCRCCPPRPPTPSSPAASGSTRLVSYLRIFRQVRTENIYATRKIFGIFSKNISCPGFMPRLPIHLAAATPTRHHAHTHHRSPLHVTQVKIFYSSENI